MLFKCGNVGEQVYLQIDENGRDRSRSLCRFLSIDWQENGNQVKHGVEE